MSPWPKRSGSPTRTPSSCSILSSSYLTTLRWRMTGDIGGIRPPSANLHGLQPPEVKPGKRASCAYNPAAQDDVPLTSVRFAPDGGSMDPLDARAPRMAPTCGPESLRRGRWIELAAVVGILVLVAIAAGLVDRGAVPLGWDEAVYASRSRSLVTDPPSSTWAIYRAPGLPIVGLLGGALRVHRRQPARRGAGDEPRDPGAGVGVRPHSPRACWRRSSRC